MSSTILFDAQTESSHGDRACDPESTSSWCSSASEVATASSSSDLSAGCGYNCSRHVYAKIRTRQWYEELTMEQREVIKTEYYQSYDYMTGLRTAASLGGTIMLFSLFILYKMKCRHGRHRSKNIVLDGATALGDVDIEKDGGGYLQNGDTRAMGDKRSLDAGVANSFGSRRSSRVVLTPEDFQFLTRQDHRRLSIATSSRSDGSRMSCGAIPPYRHGGMAVGDRTPSAYSIVSQNLHAPSLQTSFPRTQPPGFASDLTPGAATWMSGPGLGVEPIDILIIQPTPNVSPCGSVRRLSEDVVALTGCRSKEFSPVAIPLLSIPKPYQTKIKCKSKRSGGRRGFAAEGDFGGGILLGPGPSASTSSRAKLRPCSEDGSEMKFIDCSDSDAVSFSSDSDPFSPSESDVGSPPTPQCDFVREVLRSTSTASSSAVERDRINCRDAMEADGETNVSETRC